MPRRWADASLPMRGEWIEMYADQHEDQQDQSLPMRGEWIEIYRGGERVLTALVSPHAGRVD